MVVRWFCPSCKQWVKEPISLRCKACDKKAKEKALDRLKAINSME